jgi:malate dehydrogenase (oxaloacetate-decarboxylating)(NADP+)
MKLLDEEILAYHLGGKTATHVTKKCESQRDLSIAYSPGVALPCKVIESDNSLAYKYTSKGNSVAVISDGSAVLGLGDIGALASKPVMEGKAILFKKFANIDGIDVVLDVHDIKGIVDVCKAISPTYGGINLEDIKAPKCFEIERQLQEAVNIPVMHDDQHGTAIITTSALINAASIVNKNIEDLKVVISGAGAAAMSCAKMYKRLGVKNIYMADSKGIINHKREDLDKYKQEFVQNTQYNTLADALKGADVLLGVSRAGLVSKDMVKSMAKEPIIFVLANPVPEILPEEVLQVRDDAIIATGRSDYPNQVNNVLCFPYIFRGAIDVQATKITENMKMSAALALAELAKEKVSYDVKKAYGGVAMSYGKEHIIPTPFNNELLVWVSSAVAKAAVDDGVANIKDFDLDEYRQTLRKIKH